MQIFVLNLDRHSARWQRMENLLHGLAFKRIAAVDGKTIDGPENRDRSQPMTFEMLSRYELGCVLSHRAAWQEFLAGDDPYCCVLEDDVFISPDFPRFINDETWIPKDCGVLKIETFRSEIFASGKTIACLDRKAALLRSLHFGTAGYIISRRGAEVLLAETVRPNVPLDSILYDEIGREKLQPVYQLFPALCIQANRQADGIAFSELESSIQRKVKTSSKVIKAPKTVPHKIKRELSRPFFQLKKSAQSNGVIAFNRFKGIRRCTVPFA